MRLISNNKNKLSILLLTLIPIPFFTGHILNFLMMSLENIGLFIMKIVLQAW